MTHFYLTFELGDALPHCCLPNALNWHVFVLSVIFLGPDQYVTPLYELAGDR